MAPFYILKLTICFNFLFFVTFVDGQAQPIPIVELKTEPTDAEIERGTELNLQCVFGQPTNNCYWLKNGIAETAIQFIGSGNCSIRLIGNDEAQGIWQCGIPENANSNRVLSGEAKITLVEPGTSTRTNLKALRALKDVFVQQPEDTIVRSGDNTILKCIFTTDQKIPVENCYWEVDGLPITIGKRYSLDGNLQQGDCSITINNATLKLDNGQWQCGLPQNADTQTKGIKSRPANLTVAVAPSDPKILKDQIQQASGSQVGVDFGQIFTLTCEADNGNPAATLKWTIAGNELPGSVTIIPGMSGKLASVTNDLSTTAFEEWKDQELKCTSSHPSYDVGQERSTSVFLTDFKKTTAASIICQNSTDSKRTLTLKANETGEFTCNGDGVPTPEYRWQVKKGNKWEKLFDNVQNLTVFSTSQEIRCIASNDKYNSYAYSQSWTIIGVPTSGTISISGTQLLAFILSFWIVKHVLN